MKSIYHILLFSFGVAFHPAPSAAEIEPDFKTLVKLKVLEDNKTPIEGAIIDLLFNHPVEQETTIYNGTTDRAGEFSKEDKISMSLTIVASKRGYYPIRLDPAVTRTTIDQKALRQIDIPVVMRRIGNPKPLYARRVSRAIPATKETIGFDLKIGDWVRPHGMGEDVDFTIFNNNEFLHYNAEALPEDLIDRLTARHKENPLAKSEYFERIKNFYEKDKAYTYSDAIKHSSGVWRGELTIGFNGSKEGVAASEADYHVYSDLRMPNLAYESDYRNSLIRKEETFSTAQARPDIGYFLRTRVQLDDAGRIKSANYSKITEDIRFDPRGRVEFTYVFNPTPNDRNLEFDPARNLFGELPKDQKVLNP